MRMKTRQRPKRETDLPESTTTITSARGARTYVREAVRKMYIRENTLPPCRRTCTSAAVRPSIRTRASRGLSDNVTT